MMNELKDKVVLITGAGKGAGRVLAETFAGHGAIIAANDISPVNVDEVVARIKARGGRAKAYIDDIAKKVAAQALIKNVEDDFGRIDVLIHHAAVEPHAPLLEMDEWDWHRTLDVNLTGAFLMIQSIGRVMRAQGHGLIITLIAEAGRGPVLSEVEGSGKARVEHSRNESAAYTAGMAGLVELSHQADRELSPFGIRVYAILNLDHNQTVQEVMSLFTQEEL
jgi:NAD(P)-dependent dehydrogenase (short-subunit alcohol dehydrogenase family)